MKVGEIIVCKIRRGNGMEGKTDTRPGIVLEEIDDERVLVEIFGYRDVYIDMEEGNDDVVTKYVTVAWYSEELGMWMVR